KNSLDAGDQFIGSPWSCEWDCDTNVAFPFLAPDMQIVIGMCPWFNSFRQRKNETCHLDGLQIVRVEHCFVGSRTCAPVTLCVNRGGEDGAITLRETMQIGSQNDIDGVGVMVVVIHAAADVENP